MKLLIVDNYDSFTFNLYQLAAEVFDVLPVVLPNDHDFADVLAQNFDAVLISPGPGTPVKDTDFGISKNVILEMNVPIFGVCLGHQGIAHLMGGSVVHAPEPMHGRVRSMYHQGTGLFQDIPSPFDAVRYHSLLVAEPLPDCLERTAWTADGLLMAAAHKTRPIWSVQFHPESICSTFGRQMMQNFYRMACEFKAAEGVRSSSLLPAVDARQAASSRQREEPNLKTFVRKVPLQHSAEEIFRRAFVQFPYAFWLDSSVTREPDARFSFLGGYSAQEAECIRYYAHNRRLSIRQGGVEALTGEDLFPFLQRRLAAVKPEGTDLPFDFDGGFVGYFGYELKAICGGRSVHKAANPDCMALFVTSFVAIDHLTGQLYFVFLGSAEEEQKANEWFDQLELAIATEPVAANSKRDDDSSTILFAPAQSKQQYLENINESLRAIQDGETYEVCLTNQMVASTSVDAFEYYVKLRKLNPAPYSAFLQYPELSVACSSPERFLKINADAVVETKPIKGTSRRSADPLEDDRLKRALADDEKSRSENLMIVDLLRNDLGKVCTVGSVHVPHLMHVETYATVHQLVTTVQGTLEPSKTAVDCLQSAFPGGSMTGAPKIRTMEIIDELEGSARSIYSGSIGFLSFNGSADLNIVIRTAVFSKNTVSIGVGGAIIALSDPEEEWNEILLKSKALIATFEALDKTVVWANHRPSEKYGRATNLSKRVG